jgi:hypothetical protein
VIERPERADVVIGSSNITDGGFFTNYEGGVLCSYELPGDQATYTDARASLRRFLDPTGPTVQVLSDELLARLLARGDIPTNEQQRRARTGEARQSEGAASPFGVEFIPSPPPVPAEILNRLLRDVRSERQRRPPKRVRARPVVPGKSAEIVPMSFYMTLPKMRGNIPGESRVPLEARDLAPAFWGWRDKYKYDRGPRGSDREYWNWKPRWRIGSSDNPNQVFVAEVRMYEYKDSSDFRFNAARRLRELGADEGDIVRITRVAEPGVEFECVLARRGTATYDEWLPYCTESVRSSDRRYGYA